MCNIESYNSRALYQPKSMMTQTDAVINPLKGCKRECTWNGKNYCGLCPDNFNYSKSKTINHRDVIFKEQLFHNIVINNQPANSCIFVGSAGEMFGPWNNDDTIISIIAMMASRPDCSYWIQTTYPERMFSFQYTSNVVLATKIEKWDNEGQHRAKQLQKALSKWKGNNITAITVGPFIQALEPWVYKLTDQLVVHTSKTSWLPKPQKEWIEQLVNTADSNNVKVYMDPNMKKYTPQNLYKQELHHAIKRNRQNNK